MVVVYNYQRPVGCRIPLVGPLVSRYLGRLIESAMFRLEMIFLIILESLNSDQIL
jgi:hypothetical protein